MGGKGSGPKIKFGDEFHRIAREKVAESRARRTTGAQHQRDKKEEMGRALQTFNEGVRGSNLYQTLIKRRFPRPPKRRGV